MTCWYLLLLVEQPTRFQLTINLTAVKPLELAIPLSLLVRADRIGD